jgi:proliferating cell nuclear antigen PCNA
MKLLLKDKKKKDTFISIFQLLKNASSQINVMFDPERCHIQGMDKSHICLFDLSLSKDWFDSYEADQAKLCFDSSIFYSMISIKGDEQNLNISTLDNDQDNIKIELVNPLENLSKKADFNKFFVMPLMEYEYEEMVIPNAEYDSEITLPAKKVTDMLSQLSNFGNDLNIVCDDEYTDFKTTGISGEMRVNIQVDDMISYSVVEGEQLSLTYSLSYISKMCITNKLSSDIEFNLSGEFPMKIKYDLGEESCLLFYIAPKMSDGE